MKEIRGTLVLDTLEEIANPKHTAVLVIDVQNDNSSPKGFLAFKGVDISWIREVVPRIRTIIDEARRLGLLVVFMRVTKSRSGCHESGPRLRYLGKAVLPVNSVEYQMEGTWGNEILDELEPRQNEPQIIKYRSSSFMGTPLDMVLKNRDIKTAVVVGQVTEGCVESTVRDLEQYGYYPVVLRDCVCSNRLDLHQAALLVMSYRYDVVTSTVLLNIWHTVGNTGA